MRSLVFVVLVATTGCIGRAQVVAAGFPSNIPDAPNPTASLGSNDRHGNDFVPAVEAVKDRIAQDDTFLSEAADAPGAEVPHGQSQSPTTMKNARPWEIFQGNEEREESAHTGYSASSYVPIDSWIYPAFDRLAAEGYIPTNSAGIRPWTRLECARMLAEAHENADRIEDVSASILEALDIEFGHETGVIDGRPNKEAQIEDVYARVTGIAGTPLRDDFHFGQTLVDDFGRPYGQGTNVIAGFSGHTDAGPFSIYIRSEYQYASSIPAYIPAAQQVISAYEGLPFGWNLRFGTTSRVRPLEAYASLNVANWQISFGQQSLWWGPDRTTSLILSNNAAPMPMLRIARAKPFKMPGLLDKLGPVHFDSFMARQGGIHYLGLGPNFTFYGTPSQAVTPPPYLWGVALSIKPTDNLELGFSHTVIFAGYGRPLTFGTFLHTFSVLGNGQDVDPGKRATEFNFTYHLPGSRNVVLYDEAFAWDDPIEGKFVARYAMDPGIYIPKVPGLKKVDLRMEGVYTNLPKLLDQAYFYANAHYPQGYTNYGQILGSWVGRQGSGGQASTSYWFSARNKATLTYRRMIADKSFLEGGNLTDASANVTWLIKPQVEVSAMCQYEARKFPLLQSTGISDFTTTFGVRFIPKERLLRVARP